MANYDNGGFFLIHDWMIKKLNLSGNELLVYALIYSYSEKCKSYYGGVEQLMTLLNISKNTTIKILKSLREKGLIVKTTTKGAGYIKYTSYHANMTYAKSYKKAANL